MRKKKEHLKTGLTTCILCLRNDAPSAAPIPRPPPRAGKPRGRHALARVEIRSHLMCVLSEVLVPAAAAATQTVSRTTQTVSRTTQTANYSTQTVSHTTQTVSSLQSPNICASQPLPFDPPRTAAEKSFAISFPSSRRCRRYPGR